MTVDRGVVKVKECASQANILVRALWKAEQQVQRPLRWWEGSMSKWCVCVVQR